MKKLILILLLVLTGTTVLLAQSATFKFPTIQNPETFLTVPAMVTETEDLDLVLEMALIIHFDPEVLEFSDVSYPNPNFPEGECSSAYPEPGDLRLIWYHIYAPGQSFNPPEILFEIEFEYLGGCSPLIWDTLAILAYGASEVSIFSIDGSIGCVNQFNTWEGSIDDNWHNPYNWSFGMIPQGDNTEVPYSDYFNYPVIYETAVADSLIIHPNASLNVAPGGNLTTNGIVLNNGIFLIQSDSSGIAGSFIDNEGMAGTGSFEFNRHITNSSTVWDPTAWHYLSSPTNNFNTNSIPDYFVNTWNEYIPSWVPIEGSEPCTPPYPPVTLSPMQSWCIKLDPAYISNCGFGTGEIITMLGDEFNSGEYTIPFSCYSGSSIPGWNLIGNPYPSSIDPSLISWHENLNQSIYLWDGWLNNYFTWAGGVGIQSIPPTQGFFVNAFGYGTLSFSDNERIHDTETPWLKEDIENLLTLKASNIDNEYYDLTHIRFLEEATNEFDKEWDAYKLLSNTGGVPQIYTSFSDDILSINSLPETSMIIVSFESVSSGSFSIEVIETSNFEFIVLEDLFTGGQIDLLSESYIFNFSDGDDPDRFLVHFIQTGTVDSRKDNFNIWAENNNILVVSENPVKGEIIIYDVIGKRIANEPLNSKRKKITGLHRNVLYIVEVITTNDRIIKKILVK